MRGSFEPSFELVLKLEAADKGTAKRFGIDRETYAMATGQFPEEADLSKLNVEAAQTLHRVHFWGGVCGDQLPAGLDLMLYDAAVCHGIPRSVVWLQAILRDRQDAVISSRTLSGVNAYVSRYTLVTLINTFKKERLFHVDRTMVGRSDLESLGTRMRSRIDHVTAKACSLAVRI